MPQSIEREVLNVVQEICKLSDHNCSKVLGVLLEFCDSRMPNTPCFLFSAVFSRSVSRSGSVVFFCVCFVLFEHFMKLGKTAIEQESLQAAYSFLK